ncbi:MAG: carboxypeptidase-like regulatory domain-containing protein [Candidatus Acidiferrales bacterium]
MKSRFGLLCAFFLCLMLLVPCLSYAQGVGTINGAITDPSGSVVAAAKVTATQAGTSFTRDADTDADGFFVLPSMAPAVYRLAVTATGFKTETEEVTLLANQSLTVNFQLSLGSASESVTVTGTALAVDTSTSTLKTVVEGARINDLPLNGRNVAQLATSVAGAVIAPNGGMDQGPQKTFPGALTISANGTRGDQTSYMLDGGDYMDTYTNVNQPFPFPDELAEFSVQTSNYTAEYGNNAGAVVNVITNSGTNAFHGDAFDYIRNPVFNAKNYLAPTDVIKRNQYGGTVGGPIKKNKLYFFAGYQREALRNVASTTQHMPGSTDIANFLASGEPCSAQGTNTGLAAGTITAPATGGGVNACGNGVIDSSIAKMMGINATTGLPLTNPTYALAGLTTAGVTNIESGVSPVACPAGSNPCASFPIPDTENYDSGMGRFDYQLATNDKLTGRYEFDRFVRTPFTPPTELLAYTDGQTIISQNALLHETHTFSAMLLNDFRLSYSRETSVRGPGTDAPDVENFGSLLPDTATTPAIDAFAVQNGNTGNGFSFGTNPHGEFLRSTVVTSDDISWEKGKHDLHFGGDLERSEVDLNNEFNEPGLFGFCSNDSFLGQSSGNATQEQRGTYTNLLAGDLCDTSATVYGLQQGGGEFKSLRTTYAGLYLQDNLRLRKNLTVNLGLRWEPANMPNEITDHRYTCINLALMAQGVRSTEFPDAPPGLLYGGDPGCPQNGMNSSFNNFEPRVGFAWDVFGDGKTSVRGGGGIFYDSRIAGVLSNRFVDEWPYSPQFIESTAASPNAGSTAGSFTDPLCTQSATQTRLACSGAQAAAYKVNFPTFPGPFAPPKDLPVATSIPYPYVPGNNLDGSFSTAKYYVPTVYAYNLTIERQLPGDSLFRIAYVGSVSNHNLETVNLNPTPPQSPLNPANPGAGAINTGTGVANALLGTFCEPNTSVTYAPGVTPTQANDCGATTATVAGMPQVTSSTFIPTTALSPTGLLEDAFDINANYNAAQVSFEKRATRGLTLLVNYTFSKSLDDEPFGQGAAGFDGTFSPVAITNPQLCKVPYTSTTPCPTNESYTVNRHDLDWGPSDFDSRHVLNASFVYKTPSFHGSSEAMRLLAGGWEITGIVTAASGRPVTPIENANNISGNSLGSERGTLCGTGLVVNSLSTDGLFDSCVPGLSPYNNVSACTGVSTNCNSLLDSQAFEPFTVCKVPYVASTSGALSCPPTGTTSNTVNNPAIFGTLGDLGKNTFRLPYTYNWDVSFAKTFQVTERYGLTLRVDYLNVFNRVNFAPNYTATNGANNASANFGGVNQLNSSAFGALDGSSGVKAADPRVAQLSAKFTF